MDKKTATKPLLKAALLRAAKALSAAIGKPSVDDVRSTLASIRAPRGMGWSGGSKSDRLLRNITEQKNSRGRTMLTADSTASADVTEDLVVKRLNSEFGAGLFAVEGGDYSVGVQFLYDEDDAEDSVPSDPPPLRAWKKLTPSQISNYGFDVDSASVFTSQADSGVEYIVTWNADRTAQLNVFLGDSLFWNEAPGKVDVWVDDFVKNAEGTLRKEPQKFGAYLRHRLREYRS